MLLSNSKTDALKKLRYVQEKGPYHSLYNEEGFSQLINLHNKWFLKKNTIYYMKKNTNEDDDFIRKIMLFIKNPNYLNGVIFKLDLIEMKNFSVFNLNIYNDLSSSSTYNFSNTIKYDLPLNDVLYSKHVKLLAFSLLTTRDVTSGLITNTPIILGI